MESREKSQTLPNLFRQKMRLAAGIFAATVSILLVSTNSLDHFEKSKNTNTIDNLVDYTELGLMLAATGLIISADSKIKLTKQHEN